MAYFPLFLNLNNKNILVVGAGNVGARKIEKLIPFGPRIIIVADKISDEVLSWSRDSKNNLELHQRLFSPQDLEGKDIVIIATDDIQMQKEAFEFCREHRVPVNCVDVPEYCSFIFPALVVRGDATIAISTAGRAPGLSRQLRELLDNLIPHNLQDIVNQVASLREQQKQRGLSFAEKASQVGALAKSLLAQHVQAKTNPDEN